MDKDEDIKLKERTNATAIVGVNCCLVLGSKNSVVVGEENIWAPKRSGTAL
jgi:hypothetical protein